MRSAPRSNRLRLPGVGLRTMISSATAALRIVGRLYNICSADPGPRLMSVVCPTGQVCTSRFVSTEASGRWPSGVASRPRRQASEERCMMTVWEFSVTRERARGGSGERGADPHHAPYRAVKG